MRTLKICSLSNFQINNIALLTIASILHLTLLELIPLKTGEKEEGGKKQKEREWKKIKTRNPNNEHAYKINSTFLLTFITPCIPRKSFLIFVIILKISRNFQFWNVCQYVWLIWLVSCRVTCVLGTSCHHKITFHTTVDFVVLGQTTKLCWEADAEGLVNCTY